MKHIAAWLSELSGLGIILRLEGEALKFSAPKGALTQELRNELKMRKPEVIAFLKETQAAVVVQSQELPPMTPVSETDIFPLSYAQEGFWFLNCLEGKAAANNITGAVQVNGDFHYEIFRDALNELVAGHWMLRSQFFSKDGVPWQRIEPEGQTICCQLDITDLEPEKQVGFIKEKLAEETLKTFDLEKDSLLKTTVIRRQDQGHVIILNMHHIVSDGWSFALMINELFSIYEYSLKHQELPARKERAQYAAYAKWQRTHFEKHFFKKQMTWWREHLSGSLPVIELPFDQPLTAKKDNQGAVLCLNLEPSFVSELKRFGQRENATVFMLLFSIFELLLSRISGQDDLIIGTPIANRNRGETEGIIGPFINNLPIRVQLNQDLSFREHLQQLRKTILSAFEHQDIPFEKLVEEIQPERDKNRNPIFDVMFNYINTPKPKLHLSNATITGWDLEERGANFPLSLYAEESSEGLSLRLLYNVHLFTKARMEAFLDQYACLLNQVIDSPELPIAQYSLVSKQALALLPNPKEPLEKPDYPFVTEIFRDRVKELPQHTAIQVGQRSWSYQQLLYSAEQIAKYLHNSDLKPGDVVAVSGRRSYATIASMLGVFMARAVLLNIDPSLPNNRKQVMFEEAKARFLLCIGNEADADWGAQPLCYLQPDGEGFPEIGEQELVALDIDDNAYLFFTSGTTGTPKAVLGTHLGLAQFLAWQGSAFDIQPSDRHAQLTGLSFDVVLRDIFLPLTRGATLCLPTHESIVSEETFQWMQEQKITAMHTVPSLAKAWLSLTERDVALPSLRYVFFAGEPLTAELIEQWRRNVSSTTNIVNLYGPTETTLAKCFQRIAERPERGIQPIGRPIPHAQALVFSEAKQLCGIGEIGEIVIRTPYRSRGYFNGVEETRKKFVANPYTNDPSDLLYFTGDLGRYLPDGRLEILGRRDHQIKIHGIRIELGEIEKALTKHIGVRDAAVIVDQDHKGDKILLAYIVLADGVAEAGFSRVDLRNYLQRRLPEFMIPTAFTFIDKLPLTANGKLHRAALPKPDLTGKDREVEFVAPKDEVEKQLQKIWEELLDIRPISRLDNYFAIGGHSLLAVRMIARVEKQFHKTISLAQLFEYPTLEALAELLRRGDFSQEKTSLVLLQQGPKQKAPFFCVPGGGGSILYLHDFARQFENERPFYGLEAVGLDNESEPHGSVEEMAEHYLEEIVKVQPEGPYYLGGHSFGGKVAYEMAHRLGKQGHKVALLALFDSKPPSEVVSEDSWDNARWLYQTKQMVEQLSGERIECSYEKLASLEEEEQFKYLNERLSEIQWLPEEVDLKLTRGIAKVARANVKTAYVPTEKSQVPIRYFRSMEALHFAEQMVYEVKTGEACGWEPYTDGAVDIIDVPGNHLTILSRPHVQVLAAELMALMDEKSREVHTATLT